MAKTRTYKQGQLEKYRRRVLESRQWRKDEGYEDLWVRMIDLYAGKQFEGLSHQDRIAVNIAFSTVNIIYPSTTVNHPKLTLTARNPEDNDKAIIAEAVMDYMWKSEDISAGDEFRLAVKDFLTLGHGWVKTGWRYSAFDVARTEDDIDADWAAQAQQLDTQAMEQPELAGDMPTDEEIMAGISATTQQVTEDRVFVERVSPFDVLVDPEATTTRNMKWIAQRIVRPLDDVKADKSYDSRARNQARSDVTAKWGVDADKRKRPSDIERVTVWEFYDLDSNMMCVFAELGEGWLVKPTQIPHTVGHPFVMIRNYEVPDRFYPMGDLEGIEPLQHELNRTRAQLMAARKGYVRKYIADEALITPQNRAALESDVDGEVVLVNTNNGEKRIDQVLIPAPIQQIPAELFGYGEMIQSDANQVTGVSEYQQGGGGDIRRTATEASMIQDATNARSADKLATVEKTIARIGRNMLELCRQYLTGDHVARIVGNHGKPIWVPYTQEDIDVDADFEVEGGSTTPKNEGFRQNQAMQLANAIGPMVGQVIDPAQFVKWMLKAYGINDSERWIMAPPPPMPGMPGEMPPGMGGPEGVPLPGGPMPEQAVEEPPVDPAMAGMDPAILEQLAGQVGFEL